MSATGWGERVRALLHDALEQPEEDRATFLSKACQGDEAIRREVESLVEAHAAAGGFLETPAFRVATEVPVAPALQPGDRVGSFEVIGDPGPRRHGRGLPRAGCDARSRRRDQGPAASPFATRSAAARPVRARIHGSSRRSTIPTSPRSTASSEINGVRFLILELVEGPTLADRLRAEPLPPARRSTSRLQIAGALEAAHERGHRPPRSETSQHQDRRPDVRDQAARFRPREGARRRRRAIASAPHRDRNGDHRWHRDLRHVRVHEPGTGARQAGGQAHGHLGVRLRALRDADRQAGVPRRDALGHHRGRARARAGLVPAAGRDTAAHSAGASSDVSRRIRIVGCTMSRTRGSSSRMPRRSGVTPVSAPRSRREDAGAATRAVRAGLVIGWRYGVDVRISLQPNDPVHLGAPGRPGS